MRRKILIRLSSCRRPLLLRLHFRMKAGGPPAKNHLNVVSLEV